MAALSALATIGGRMIGKAPFVFSVVFSVVFSIIFSIVFSIVFSIMVLDRDEQDDLEADQARILSERPPGPSDPSFRARL